MNRVPSNRLYETGGKNLHTKNWQIQYQINKQKQYKQVQALDVQKLKNKKGRATHIQTEAKFKNESYKTMKIFYKYFRKTN